MMGDEGLSAKVEPGELEVMVESYQERAASGKMEFLGHYNQELGPMGERLFSLMEETGRRYANVPGVDGVVQKIRGELFAGMRSGTDRERHECRCAELITVLNSEVDTLRKSHRVFVSHVKRVRRLKSFKRPFTRVLAAARGCVRAVRRSSRPSSAIATAGTDGDDGSGSSDDPPLRPKYSFSVPKLQIIFQLNNDRFRCSSGCYLMVIAGGDLHG